MANWALHESYDPANHVLYLYLVADSAEAPRRPGLDAPKLLESFADLETARKFAEGYRTALDGKGERVIQKVRCGMERLGGCRGPGKTCYLDLDCYRCEIRES
ncbi:MAG: hypothetical protein HYX59_02780 [Elusimicrobia bacterium]|nr:hypothetical protein [Elusimicrobiota bacterium]